MYDVRITAVRKVCHRDLMELYENPIEHACDIEEGQVFISVGGRRPEGLCESAWGSMEHFVRELANGGGNFFDGWMKDPRSAMISCNDGFRPVSFYLEAIVDRFFRKLKGVWGPPGGPAAWAQIPKNALTLGLNRYQIRMMVMMVQTSPTGNARIPQTALMIQQIRARYQMNFHPCQNP